MFSSQNKQYLILSDLDNLTSVNTNLIYHLYIDKKMLFFIIFVLVAVDLVSFVMCEQMCV